MTDAELRARLATTAPSGDVMVPRATLERLLRAVEQERSRVLRIVEEEADRWAVAGCPTVCSNIVSRIEAGEVAK